LRALVVDDERLARTELRRLLREHQDVEVIGEAAHVDQAVERASALVPDLLFLDIEMPGGSGFDVLQRLEEPPMVVFTTAFDAYAVKAFEFNALDYLLKPVEPGRLAAALARVRARKSAAPPPGVARPPLQRVFVRDGELCLLVELISVRLVESEGNYSRLHVDGQAKQPLLLRSLNYLEERLDPECFFRANRRQLVNVKRVERIEAGRKGNLVLVLDGGALEVEMSRRQSVEFRRRMGA
jgi:two-component system LytT family response regulator